MKTLVFVFRLFLGAIYLIFGLNGLFSFLPGPTMAPAARNFIDALMATGYMFPLWKGVEVATGISLLAGRFVPLMLVVALPITLNIFLVHLILDPASLAIGLLLLLLHALLLLSHLQVYRPLLRSRS
jgi:hypothetical protein